MYKYCCFLMTSSKERSTKVSLHRSVALLPVGNYRSFQQLVNINHSLATTLDQGLATSTQGPRGYRSAPFLQLLYSFSQLRSQSLRSFTLLRALKSRQSVQVQALLVFTQPKVSSVVGKVLCIGCETSQTEVPARNPCNKFLR